MRCGSEPVLLQREGNLGDELTDVFLAFLRFRQTFDLTQELAERLVRSIPVRMLIQNRDGFLEPSLVPELPCPTESMLARLVSVRSPFVPERCLQQLPDSDLAGLRVNGTLEKRNRV
jgi:hypothetical protein